MADVAKRDIVITRISRELDSVDVKDRADQPITEKGALLRLYSELCDTVDKFADPD